ncbi:MAG: fasciclin domain-containing protein, partial [Flammeovirgaceae bacterium]|nr:fasciclin domain-containing protein [Flammeovirgaceae bacterium]
MKKMILTPLKFFAMFALALSLVLFSNCSEDDPAIDDTIDDGTDDGTDDGSATESLLDLLASTEGLDTLESLVNLYPDVAAVVASASGNYTLFAPTNDAFATLYATVGVAKASDVNKDIVLAILGYHVSGTDYPTLTAGTTISTLVPNETIVVNDDGTLLTGSSNSAIPVISSTEATNGTMHIVESVLIPPTIGSTLTALLGTNAATVLIGGSFTTIGAALTKSEEFAATAGAPSLTAYLAGESSSTVFAVPDAVFEAGGIGVDDLTSQEWYGLISHHIVGKSIKAADLTGDAGQAGIMVNSLLPFPGGEQGSFVPHWIQYIPGKGNFSSVFIDSDVQIITVYMTALALGEDQQGALNAVYAYEAEAGPAIWNAEILYPDAVTNVNGMVHVLYGYLSPYPAQDDQDDFGNPMEGSWTLLPEAGSLAVGPSPTDLGWWSISEADILLRTCQFDDVYKFDAGTFNEADSTWTGQYELILDGSTWREGWQATTEGCGAPVAPHDASNAPFTYTVDLINETVTLTGIGAYMGLPKVYNGGELSA